jgi:hypothetical protein
MQSALLVADTHTSSVKQDGLPTSQVGAWFIDVPDGSDAVTAATAWVENMNFPVGTRVWLYDPADYTPHEYDLQSQWVQVS